MIYLSLFLLAVVLAVLIIIGARWWTWRPLVHRRVLLQLADGSTLAGLIMSRRGPLLVLADVSVHLTGAQSTPVDGHAVIERDRVLWMQVV